MNNSWLYRFKWRIIVGLALLLLGSTVISMLYITLTTRDHLLENSEVTSRELAGSIGASLRSLMLRRSPEEIQSAISQLGQDKHIARIFILNRDGRVVYSSASAEKGTMLSMTDASCRGCHTAPGVAPSGRSSIVSRINGDVQRNVTVIYNDPECFGCHPAGQRINGKLIIDCSLAPTYALIADIRMAILGSAAVCLLVILLLIPVLSRSIDRYIEQVLLKSNEISMIYSIIESVSKSIDMEDLKNITLDIVGKTFSSDEVNIVLPLRDGQYRVINRSEGESRRLQAPGERLSDAISRWQAGEMHGREVLPDKTTVYLSIEKGSIPLALLEIRSPGKPFPEEKLRFMDSVINPIAIAFENARLYTIAITDELTGLYTVRHFRTCLDRQRDAFEGHGEKFGLLLIDIDNFKSVNDTYGHPVGDQVLKRVSRSIAEAVRDSDLAFRYGGEEFAVLLPATGEAGGITVAERIRAMVEENATDIDGVQLRSTVSIGLALFPGNAVTVRDLVVEADNALYTAKRSGKNRVVSSDRHSAA